MDVSIRQTSTPHESRANVHDLVSRANVHDLASRANVHDLASRANRHHPGKDTVLASQDRNLGAVGVRSLKRSLDEEEEDRTKQKESSLGERKSSRAFNSVRAIAKP